MTMKSIIQHINLFGKVSILLCRRYFYTYECRTSCNVSELMSPLPPSPGTGIRNHCFLPLVHFSLVSVTILKSVVLKAADISISEIRSVFSLPVLWSLKIMSRRQF